MRTMLQLVLLQMQRRTLMRPLALLSIALLLSSCATQSPSLQVEPTTGVSSSNVNVPTTVQSTPQIARTPDQEVLRSLVALQDRLYRVAAPLLVNNAELCKGKARNLLGFTAKNKYSYSSDLSTAAQELFKLDEQLRVMGILAGSGAERSGVQRGDILLAAEDKPMSKGSNAERNAAAILAPLVGNHDSIKLTMLRNDIRINLNVPLTLACAFSIELGNTDNPIAYSDGRRILVARGMLQATQSDEELAYVLAKEMAHSALDHARKQRMNATLGGIIDNLILLHPDMSTMVGTAGVKPMPQELDAAADTLSLYMLARAGYKLDNAIAFWQRLANQYPPTVLNGYTAIHPATAYRVSLMQKAIVNVKAKQANKKPLRP
jgi:beta-barrel assembly-enhancing protease